MGTLKTTLKVESTDLFPTPVNFTQVNNNTCSGDTQNFTLTLVGTSPVQLNLTSIAVTTAAGLGGAYVYLRSKASNTGSIYLDNNNAGPLTANNGVIALAPGDTAFVRLGNQGGGTALWAIATAAGQELEYFLGEK